MILVSCPWYRHSPRQLQILFFIHCFVLELYFKRLTRIIRSFTWKSARWKGDFNLLFMWTVFTHGWLDKNFKLIFSRQKVRDWESNCFLIWKWSVMKWRYSAESTPSSRFQLMNHENVTTATSAPPISSTLFHTLIQPCCCTSSLLKWFEMQVLQSLTQKFQQKIWTQDWSF